MLIQNEYENDLVFSKNKSYHPDLNAIVARSIFQWSVVLQILAMAKGLTFDLVVNPVVLAFIRIHARLRGS